MQGERQVKKRGKNTIAVWWVSQQVTPCCFWPSVPLQTNKLCACAEPQERTTDVLAWLLLVDSRTETVGRASL